MVDRRPMAVVGLTGGIASGKSTVARRFAERGVPVVDADAIAREVVAPGEPALEAIRRAFGEPLSVRDDTPERLTAFLPGDVVFWAGSRGSEFPNLAGIVLDRRDALGAPLVATLYPPDGAMSDHHRVDEWPVLAHIRIRPDRFLERFLEDNLKARLAPRPQVTP